ncbi:MAG: ABC transporter ATP-binding protein [Firmicutes bacterium]|nr:ABC transporter ATP-binding protein [Bacillota bacterium]
MLSVRDLVIKFRLRGRVLTAIRGLSLDLHEGEALALVGESGSGKTVLTKSWLGMLDPNGWIDRGAILMGARDLARLRAEREWLGIRGRQIAMIFQDPMTALNPLRTVGAQVQEALELHQGLRGSAARERAVEILAQVGIHDAASRYHQYPHQFSGGMRQRVVIAIAIACRPRVLICDEPTTALDVTVQAQILELIGRLQRELGIALVFITHDLGVVARVADRVAVMYAGQIVEQGTVEEIFYDPRHPYTWALLASLPQLGVKGEPLHAIPGAPPNLLATIRGDPFAPRNPYALAIDLVQEPRPFQVSPTHWARTWLLDPRAPRVQPPPAVRRLRERRHWKGGWMGSDGQGHGPAAANRRQQGTRREVRLEVRDLRIEYRARGRRPFVAVDGVSFEVYRGETLGLVGETGSGKSSIGRAIVRITETAGGEIRFRGRRIDGRIPRQLARELTRRIQMIFQDPMASLNERAKVDYIVSEGLYNTRAYRDEQDRRARVASALREVGLLPEFASRFPHEFSGGQRQRIGIARALIMEPELVIADEPVSSLDVSVRAQVLNLLQALQRQKGLTYLFISHDLSVVRYIADRVAVMHRGRLVELAETEELFRSPLHPYTRALLSAIPVPDPRVERNRRVVRYEPPDDADRRRSLRWAEVRPGHWVLADDAELEAYRRALEGR